MSIPDNQPSLIPGHAPKPEEVQYSIGPYQILSSIATGGMGEVLLAYDTGCGRRIALKKIREDLLEKKQMHDRFLNEARITAQLTHPSIIPIYTIQDENNITYYTMPHVQGETLREILFRTHQQQKEGEKMDHIGGSIPALMRIYLSICQAVAYAHHNKVLHRDLKPENIIIGKYGEVLILDWGLAKLFHEAEEETDLPESHPAQELTHVGKIVGTLTFMAPERALHRPATAQTDIYALGVILFQMLTLRSPFRRPSLKEFRKNLHKEVIPEPAEIAPYRDVPNLLANIAKKCLHPDPKERYQTVDRLIHELENYIEGRSEWFLVGELDLNNKEDWEFQENVLIAEHIAITRGTEVSEWVNLMISRESLHGNTKIEADLRLKEGSQGIGILMSIPEASERMHINDGYCLWIGSEKNKSTKLLRSTLEVLSAPEIFLKPDTEYRIRLEKIDNNIYFYINEELQFSYISHLPLIGTHVGLLSRDAEYELEHFRIYTASQSITINCLAVPDAFLSQKDYTTALAEYRRIGYSFPDRAEGREAMFRAGVTLMDQARNSQKAKERKELFHQSLEEFEKLHGTPGAPLEYLGKALVYRTLGEYEEEFKCFELAYRRYPKHPLLPILHEQTIYRMHETSRKHRKATYRFSFLASRHLPKELLEKNAHKLFSRLQSHWEELDFLDPKDPKTDKLFSIQLAFWLAKPYFLQEIIEEQITEDKPSRRTLFNAIWCLLELHEIPFIEDALRLCEEKGIDYAPIKTALQGTRDLARTVEKFTIEKADFTTLRTYFFLLQCAIDQKDFKAFDQLIQKAAGKRLPDQAKKKLSFFIIQASMYQGRLEEAGELLHHFPLSTLTDETNPLHFLYGVWLSITEGKEIAEIHMSSVLDVLFPRSWLLACHFITGKLRMEEWEKNAFWWEKLQLYRQLTLFYHCLGEKAEEKIYEKKGKELLAKD